MDFAKNEKYFYSTDTHFYVGIITLIVGALLAVLELFWFMFMPYQMVVGIAIAIVGAGIAFIPRSKRSNEKDLDGAVTEMTQGYEKQVTEDLSLSRSLVRGIAPVVYGNYVYGEEHLLRRGKDDRKCRSSQYTAAAILTTKHGLVVSVKTFSLIRDEVKESLHEILFSDLVGMTVRDDTYTLSDGSKIKNAHLVITAKEKEDLTIPVHHVIAIDRLCEDILHHADAYKTSGN